MSIVLVGLNHRTAPVELREQLSLAGSAQALDLLQIEAPALHESVILCTCNRLEIYAVTGGEAVTAWAAIEDFLGGFCEIPVEALHPHLYFREEQDAVHHLMRVAAGLDSMILGEPQVLGQVAQAFGMAHDAGASGPILSHLFAQAVHAGKRARAETDISRYTTSVSHAAARLVQSRIGDLSRSRTLIVGAGDMAELAVQALQMHGAQDIACINRTYAKAEALAQQVGGRAFRWPALDDALVWADVVITATGAPHTVIYAADVAQTLAMREGRPLVFVDVAVPRDVEEAVDYLPAVQRFDIDDLESALDANMAQRQAAIPRVTAIVEGEAAAFREWLRSRQVTPVIVDLRHKAEALADAEVEQALHRLQDLTPHDREIIARMAHRIVNKVLHEPTVRLKAYAAGGNGYGYAHAVRDLFALGSPADRICLNRGQCEAQYGTCNLQCILQDEWQ